MFDVNGKLIGITNAGNNEDQNINYAIPVSAVKGAVEYILCHYDGETASGVWKPTTGLTLKTENSRYVYDGALGYGTIREDLVASGVSGIEADMDLEVGDKLTAIVIDGTSYTLHRDFELSDAYLLLTAGTEFYFVYDRGTEVGLRSDVHTIDGAELSLIA